MNKPIIRPRDGKCDSACPQRPLARKGLGRCGILGYEVRAEPDAGFCGVEPPPSERCPVLAIREVVVEPAPRLFLCGVCRSARTVFRGADPGAVECLTCGATAVLRYSDRLKEWAVWKSWEKPAPPTPAHGVNEALIKRVENRLQRCHRQWTLGDETVRENATAVIAEVIDALPAPDVTPWAVEALRRIAAQTHEDCQRGRRCATCIAIETLADHGATARKP
jgi:hypothetical protein